MPFGNRTGTAVPRRQLLSSATSREIASEFGSSRSPVRPSSTFRSKSSLAERGSNATKNLLESLNSASLKRSGLDAPTCGSSATSWASVGLNPEPAPPPKPPVLIT
jgi:hypothetical protein